MGSNSTGVNDKSQMVDASLVKKMTKDCHSEMGPLQKAAFKINLYPDEAKTYANNQLGHYLEIKVMFMFY